MASEKHVKVETERLQITCHEANTVYNQHNISRTRKALKEATQIYLFEIVIGRLMEVVAGFEPPSAALRVNTQTNVDEPLCHVVR